MEIKWILLGASGLILIAADIVLTVFILSVVANLSLGRVK